MLVLVSVRQKLYLVKLFKQTRLAIPVIVVGNISVGGTGKTPFIIWLVNYLKQQGYSVAVVSRGYGGYSENYPVEVETGASASEVGDEPLLLFSRLNIPVVVDPNRSRAAQYIQQHYKVDLIIADDGMQHYQLARDAEVCIIDGYRYFGNKMLLPFGPLREPISRLKDCDLVVQNSGKQQLEYYFTVQPLCWVNLTTSEQRPIEHLVNKPVYAVCGIGNPNKFAATLDQLAVNYHMVAFDDHHRYQVSDFAEAGDNPVIMTEKDADKCRAFAQADWWYLKVDIAVNQVLRDDVAKLVKRLLS
jgi:tetraacyldisaccharide 4'-kinase